MVSHKMRSHLQSAEEAARRSDKGMTQVVEKHLEEEQEEKHPPKKKGKVATA